VPPAPNAGETPRKPLASHDFDTWWYRGKVTRRDAALSSLGTAKRLFTPP
jgi:hypothetical protein